jgi:hypothetical protein
MEPKELMPVIDYLPADRIPTHELEEMAGSGYETFSMPSLVEKVGQNSHSDVILMIFLLRKRNTSAPNHKHHFILLL